MFKFPISIHLDIKDNSVNEIPKNVFISSFRAVLSEYQKFAVFESSPEKAFLSVILCGDELTINLSSLSGCTFHSINSREKEELVESITADILLGCAIALTHIGQSEMAARIIFDSRLKTRFLNKHEILINMIPFLLKTSYFEETINSVGNIIQSEPDNIIETSILTSAIFEADPKDNDKSLVIEKFLIKCLEKYLSLNEGTQIGIAYYNLGNHYRSRRLFQKAIRHYLKARTYEKKYLQQPYYYQELAGALFEYEKYAFAASLYKLALDKGAPESAKPLYADALMFSGKYKLAFDVFETYLSSNKEANHSEWHLKMICLESLIKNPKFTNQSRRKKQAIELIDISKTGQKSFIVELEKAVSLGRYLSDYNEIWNVLQQGRGQTLFVKNDFFQSALLIDNKILLDTNFENNQKGIVDDIIDRKSTRLNSSHIPLSRMPSSA